MTALSWWRTLEQMQNIELQTTPFARPDVTVAVTRGVVRTLKDLGYGCILEFKLINGRRADVAGIDRKGRLVFVEVKSCRADFEGDQKWQDYLDYCDAFYFAVSADFPVELLPPEQGVILADGFGGTVNRPAAESELSPARRKAVTIRFARQAALQAISV